MKAMIYLFILAILPISINARDIFPLLTDEYSAVGIDSYETDTIYLQRLISLQKKTYDQKIAFLENELEKTNSRLIEKSMNQEKLEAAISEKFSAELKAIKTELASRTKSLFEYQRRLEKINPSEELKSMIKLNTELASELRGYEDKIAIMHINEDQRMAHLKSRGRLPASVK